MKKIYAALAALLMLAAPASADLLQQASEYKTECIKSGDLAGEEAAEKEKLSIYVSGAALNPNAEKSRIYLWNYMLNLEKQEYDYEQSYKTYIYEEAGKNQKLDFLASEAYENAQLSNVIQAEILKNDGYVQRLTEDGAAEAQKRLEELKEETSFSFKRILADAALIIAIIVFSAVVLKLLRRYCKKHGFI